MQVEGQTRGFKGASRAYRKIGDCASAFRSIICLAKTALNELDSIADADCVHVIQAKRSAAWSAMMFS